MATKTVKVGMDDAEKTVEVKTPKKRLCTIDAVLPASVIALVKASPNNDTIRNLLLAHLRVPVPKEEDDYEKIRHWIEYNITPPEKPKSPHQLEKERIERQIRDQEAVEAERRRNQVILQVSATEREHGRCSYHITQGGSGQMPINRDTVILIAANTNSAAEFFREISSNLEDSSPSDYLSMREVDGTDSYDDHDADETGDEEVTLQDAAKTELKEFLRTASPDAYQRLFGQ